jgi:hypothetical protein
VLVWQSCLLGCDTVSRSLTSADHSVNLFYAFHSSLLCSDMLLHLTLFNVQVTYGRSRFILIHHQQNIMAVDNLLTRSYYRHPVVFSSSHPRCLVPICTPSKMWYRLRGEKNTFVPAGNLIPTPRLFSPQPVSIPTELSIFI